MIEYTIVVNNINEQTGKMVVTVNPQVANTEYEDMCSPISTKIQMTNDRLNEIMSLITYNANNEVESVDGALVELRKEIISQNNYFQEKWQKEIANRTVTIPDEMKAWLGHEFPAVTQEEIDSV